MDIQSIPHMEEDSLPNDVSEYLQHATEKNKDFSNNEINFTVFVLKNLLNNLRVLKLTTYLCFNPLISRKQAAVLLRVSRSYLNELLDKTKLFNYKTVSLEGWGSGGREKRIKLSEGAEQYGDYIIALAEKLLPEKDFEECKTKVITLTDLEREKWIKKAIRTIRQHEGWANMSAEAQRFWMGKTGLSGKELQERAEIS